MKHLLLAYFLVAVPCLLAGDKPKNPEPAPDPAALSQVDSLSIDKDLAKISVVQITQSYLQKDLEAAAVPLDKLLTKLCKAAKIEPLERCRPDTTPDPENGYPFGRLILLPAQQGQQPATEPAKPAPLSPPEPAQADPDKK